MQELTLGRLISLLFRYFQIYAAGEFEQFNIGKGQALFLYALYQQDGLSQEKLAATLNIDKSTTARAINKLEQAGYVVRKKDATDMRSNKIFLTPKAEQFKPRFYSILQRWTAVLSTGMSEEEVEKALSLLTKMFHNAIDYIHRERKKVSFCHGDLDLDANKIEEINK